MRVAAVLAVAASLLAAGPARAEIASYALVQDDGTLKISGRTVRLFGILIPETGQHCDARLRPTRCRPRAVSQLEFRIGPNFVRCEPVRRLRDGSVSAVCRVGSIHREGLDLAAWMLREGWAVATPEAPLEYHVLEDVARTRERGIWGFQADSIRRP